MFKKLNKIISAVLVVSVFMLNGMYASASNIYEENDKPMSLDGFVSREISSQDEYAQILIDQCGLSVEEANEKSSEAFSQVTPYSTLRSYTRTKSISVYDVEFGFTALVAEGQYPAFISINSTWSNVSSSGDSEWKQNSVDARVINSGNAQLIGSGFLEITTEFGYSMSTGVTVGELVSVGFEHTSSVGTKHIYRTRVSINENVKQWWA